MSSRQNSPAVPSTTNMQPHTSRSSDISQLSAYFEPVTKTTDDNAAAQSSHYIDLDVNPNLELNQASLDPIQVQIRQIPFTALTMDEIRRRRQGHNPAITPAQFKAEYNHVAAQFTQELDLGIPPQLPIIPATMLPQQHLPAAQQRPNSNSIIPPPPPLPVDDLLVDSPLKVIQHAIDREVAQYGLLTQPQKVQSDQLQNASLPPDLSNLPRFGATIPNIVELEAPLEQIKNERFNTLLKKPLPTGQNSVKYADISALQSSLDRNDQLLLAHDQVLIKMCVFDPFTQMLSVEAIFTDDMPLSALRDVIGTQCPYDQVDLYNVEKGVQRRVEFERPQDIFFENIQTRYTIASLYHQLQQYKYTIETWNVDENGPNGVIDGQDGVESRQRVRAVEFSNLQLKYRSLLEELKISRDLLKGQENQILALQQSQKRHIDDTAQTTDTVAMHEAGDQLEADLFEEMNTELEFGTKISKQLFKKRTTAKTRAKTTAKTKAAPKKGQVSKESTAGDEDIDLEDIDTLPASDSDESSDNLEDMALSTTKSGTKKSKTPASAACSQNSSSQSQSTTKRQQMRFLFERHLQRISSALNTKTGLSCHVNHVHEHTIFQPHTFTQYEIDFTQQPIWDDELIAEKQQSQSSHLPPSFAPPHSQQPLQIDDVIQSSLYLQDAMYTAFKNKLGRADLIPSNLNGYHLMNDYHSKYRSWVAKWYAKIYTLKQKAQSAINPQDRKRWTFLLHALAKCALLTRPVHFPQEMFHWIPETTLLPHPSSFFFFHGTFYDDRRSPLSVSLSDSIINHGVSPHLTFDPHIIQPPPQSTPSTTTPFFKPTAECTVAQQRHVHSGLGVFKQLRQETTTFADIPFTIGQQYLFQHQGNCQHIVMCTEMRIKSCQDYNDKKMYPLVIFRANQQYLHRSTHINIFTKHGISHPAIHNKFSPFSINMVPISTRSKPSIDPSKPPNSDPLTHADSATQSELIAMPDLVNFQKAPLPVQSTTLYNSNSLPSSTTSYASQHSMVMVGRQSKSHQQIHSPFNPANAPTSPHSQGIEQITQCLGCDKLASQLVYAHPLCPRNPTPLCDPCFRQLSFEPFHEVSPLSPSPAPQHSPADLPQPLQPHSRENGSYYQQQLTASPPLFFQQLSSLSTSSSTHHPNHPLPTTLHIPFNLSAAMKQSLSVQLTPHPTTFSSSLTIKPLFPIRNAHKKAVEINKVRIQRREKRIDTIQAVLSANERSQQAAWKLDNHQRQDRLRDGFIKCSDPNSERIDSAKRLGMGDQIHPQDQCVIPFLTNLLLQPRHPPQQHQSPQVTTHGNNLVDQLQRDQLTLTELGFGLVDYQ